MARLFTAPEFESEPTPSGPKINLHDGVKPVRSISVLAMFRNNSPYLDYLFKQLANLEAAYDVEFSYYFLENDSTDDTRQKLKDFFKSGKKGRLLLGSLNKDYVNRGENYDRTMTLARLRNSLVEGAAPVSSDWTVFIDSHIYFPVNVLQRMMAVEPAKNGLGMMTGYTKQVHINAILKRGGLDVSGASPIPDDAKIDLNHYYDTYTYYDTKGYSHFPVCAFKKCNMCARIRTPQYSLPLVEANQSIVEVRSAFGGFALIDSEAINHPRIRWSTLPFDHTGDKTLCDHVLFCDRLQAVTGKKIVVLQDIDTILRTY